MKMTWYSKDFTQWFFNSMSSSEIEQLYFEWKHYSNNEYLHANSIDEMRQLMGRNWAISNNSLEVQFSHFMSTKYQEPVNRIRQLKLGVIQDQIEELVSVFSLRTVVLALYMSGDRVKKDYAAIIASPDTMDKCSSDDKPYLPLDQSIIEQRNVNQGILSALGGYSVADILKVAIHRLESGENDNLKDLQPLLNSIKQRLLNTNLTQE